MPPPELSEAETLWVSPIVLVSSPLVYAVPLELSETATCLGSLNMLRGGVRSPVPEIPLELSEASTLWGSLIVLGGAMWPLMPVVPLELSETCICWGPPSMLREDG